MQDPPLPRKRLSDYKISPYTQNLSYFDEWLSQHREHQIDASLVGMENTKGQIIGPCGVGKTRIQVSLHVEDMIALTRQQQRGNFLIASHRLSLNRQLLAELVDVVAYCGLPFDILYVGSYRCDLNRYYDKYHHLGYSPEVSNHLATTSSKQIEEFVAKSRASNRHTIIASTYDSVPRLKNIGPINNATFDEAHNTVQHDFKSNILEIKPQLQKEFYFTATRKVIGDEGGMNDEGFYGPILIDISPKLMLERGEIVAPRLHRIKGEDNETTNTSNTDMLVKNTIEAFKKHREYVKKYSYAPDQIGAKLLIGCNSIEEMLRVYFESPPDLMEKAVKVFAISSDGCFSNQNQVSKEEFFTQLNALSDAEDAIIFNVDMLTEGIDLPSITGVMPLRNLGLTKLIQLVGRALRLHHIDRQKLYRGEIQAHEHDKKIKPFGYFVIPEHLSSIDHYEDMIKLVQLFYSEYGTKAEDLLIDKFIDHRPQTLPSMIQLELGDGKDFDLQHREYSLVDEINLHLFRNDLAMLDNAAKIQYIEQLLSEP